MSVDKPVALVVGGSSGLGLELAKRLANTHRVYITGRRSPQGLSLPTGILFEAADLSSRSEVPAVVRYLVQQLPRVDLCVYAAGFYQEGTLGSLSVEDIVSMCNVGLLAPALLLRDLLHKQGELGGCIAITSTSQFTPRELEPLYTGVKAGLGMLVKSLSLDKSVGKVLVAAPGAMPTRFWDTRTSAPLPDNALDTAWVAEKILEHYGTTQKYRFIKIMRGPSRVEIAE